VTPLTSDVFSALGETLLLIDQTRQICFAMGKTVGTLTAESLIGVTWLEALRRCAAQECVTALYWAVEAAFEHYVAPRFLPRVLPFDSAMNVQVAYLDGQIACRLVESQAQQIQGLLHHDLRPSLSSVVGFADVILKGIDGPVTDIQTQDMRVIHDEAMFALQFIEDLSNHWLTPICAGPAPVNAQAHLSLDSDAYPQRRFARQGLSVEIDLPDQAMIYSNGAVRNAVVTLLKQLPPQIAKPSTIAMQGKPEQDMLKISLSFTPIDPALRVAEPLDPPELPDRRSLKHLDRIKALLFSLHQQLAPYGCTVHATPGSNRATTVLVLSVPLWNGPSMIPEKSVQ